MRRRISRVAKIATVLGQLGLGGIFLFAGTSKALDPAPFLHAVERYDLFAEPIALAIAVIVPWTETLLGVCIITGSFLPGALLGALVLSVGFVVVVASVLFRGIETSCGCFSVGPAVRYVDRWDLVGAGFMLAAAASLFITQIFVLDRESMPAREIPGYARPSIGESTESAS